MTVAPINTIKKFKLTTMITQVQKRVLELLIFFIRLLKRRMFVKFNAIASYCFQVSFFDFF